MNQKSNNIVDTTGVNIKFFSQDFDSNHMQQWDKLVEESNYAWLYNTRAYLNHVEYVNNTLSNSGLINLSFGVFISSTDELVCGMNLYFQNNPPRIDCGLSGPFYKGDYDTRLENIMFNFVDNFCRNNSLESSAMRYSMLAPAYRHLLNQPVIKNPLQKYTYELALNNEWTVTNNYKLRMIDMTKSLDTIWNEMEGRCRTSIRKAKKSGLIVKIGNDEKLQHAFSHIKGSIGHGDLSTKNMVELLEDNVQLSVVYYKEEPISVTLYHCYKDGILYYANAQTGKYKECAPNNLSKWKMIEWGKENGYKLMDVGNIYDKSFKEIDLKGYNVSRYKSSFGKDYMMPIYGYKNYIKEN